MNNMKVRCGQCGNGVIRLKIHTAARRTPAEPGSPPPILLWCPVCGNVMELSGED